MNGAVQSGERVDAAARSAGGPIDLSVIAAPQSPQAEAYRSLRSTVKFARLEPPIRSVLIADAGTNEQHSEAAANLAAALALGGDTTILVDANLRAPRLHQYFGLANERGLVDVLEGYDPERWPLLDTGLDNLQLLPAGQLPAGTSASASGDLLSSDACAAALRNLRERADFVIVDAPSLADYGDALGLAAHVDGVLLLVRSGRTRRATAQSVRDSLDRVGARILGAVLTDSRTSA